MLGTRYLIRRWMGVSIGEESWILTLVKDILERFGYSVIGVGQRGKKEIYTGG